RAAVQWKLRHWQKDSDLAGLRDAAALAKLSAEERGAYARLWADVAVPVHDVGEPPELPLPGARTPDPLAADVRARAPPPGPARHATGTELRGREGGGEADPARAGTARAGVRGLKPSPRPLHRWPARTVQAARPAPMPGTAPVRADGKRDSQQVLSHACAN